MPYSSATYDAPVGTPQVTLSSTFSELQIEERSPIMTLPNEILSEIFIQYLPPYPVCPPLLGDGSPTKLGQICGHWRDLAHSTPILWRAIELFFQGPLIHVTEFQLTTAQVWLERSRSLPLSILMGPGLCHPDDLRAKAVNCLVAHRARWEYVMLDLAHQDDFNADGCIEGALPLLLELDLLFGSDISRLDTVIGSVVVPRLRTALLDCCDFRNLRKLLPWGQLTRLFLDYVGIHTAAMTLRETTNLVHCRLNISDEDIWDGDVLSLPRLETLVIDTAITLSQLVYNCLFNLCIPALKRLSIEEDILIPADERLPLAPVLRAFGCKLERLCVPNANMSLEDYRLALPEVPCIELVDTLSAEHWGYWDLSESNRLA